MPTANAVDPAGKLTTVLLICGVSAPVVYVATDIIAGLLYPNQMEVGPGGRQIQLEDPDGNPIELFEPAR